MATAPGTPDWWLERLYKRLRDRQPQIKVWDDWYTGNHPAPKGYEKAEALLIRILDTVGLNILATVTDAALERQHVEGFKIDGKINDDLWAIWQANNFDLGSEQVFQERYALSESYVMVDPNQGAPIMTPEHPEQCIVELYPGSQRRKAGLKVWQDDQGSTPMVRAMLQVDDQVYGYAAPTRIYANVTRSVLSMRPTWELQETETGPNSLGEVSIVPFSNRARMLRAPVPEFYPAITTQKRINKTLLDRMAMQDQGAFKAMWASGLNIPRDPVTGKPVEDFVKAIDRMFVNENPDGKFGQLQAEDIKQILEAVAADVTHAAVLVPTPPDQILGTMVNVSADGLEAAKGSLISRVKRHMRYDDESLEDVGRLALKGAGKSVPNAGAMTTIWRNPEFRTEGELSDAATKALSNGVPHEAVWERYYGATPQEIQDWRAQLDANQVDPLTRQILKDAAGGNPDPAAGA